MIYIRFHPDWKDNLTMFRATSSEKIAYPLAPKPTVPDGWIIPTRPSPAYRVQYRYAWWGGQRQIHAGVYQITWYGDRLILSAHRLTARDAYRTAHRAIRAFERYGNVNYSHAPSRVRMPCPLDDSLEHARRAYHE